MTDFDVQPGDIYSLGDSHRLMCGNATNKEDVKRLFDGRKPTLVVTSPPYAKQRDYDRPIACWDSMMLNALDGHDFADGVQIFVNLGVIYKDNELKPYWNRWLTLARQRGYKLFALYTWSKSNPFPGKHGNRLTPSFEFIFHLNNTPPKVCNKWVATTTTQNSFTPLKTFTRKGSLSVPRKPYEATKKATSVLHCASGVDNRHMGHPAAYPVDLPLNYIKSYKSESHNLIYDCFAGSGTTLHAAEQEGVAGLGMEISPAYTAIALARWAKAYPDQQISKIN